jgi:hypothetical protein
MPSLDWMVMVAALVVLMTAVSPAPGTLPVLQLLPTSQLPAAGPVHWIVAGSVLSSSCSS